MTDRLLPCERDGSHPVGWLRVPDPPPLELARDGVVYVLDERSGGPVYVLVEG